MKCYLLMFILLCFSCQKYCVSVQRQRINRSSLASTYVKSPDPLQENPPTGERLVVKWRLPPHAMTKPLRLKLKMLYKNYEEETKSYPLSERTGHLTYEIIDAHYRKTQGLLAYKVEVVDLDEKLICQWKHQMWVELITPPELLIDPSITPLPVSD